VAILVTGGAGYIGSHMVHDLVDRGERVVVLDNLSTGFDWALPKSAHLVVGESGDEALVGSIVAAHRVSAIIHFAASTAVADSLGDPLGYYHNNTANSRALIAAAIRSGVAHFIFSSSAAVYGNPASSPVGENVKPEPLSPYGSSKLMTEIMLRDAARAHGIGYVVLRYFNVAGADPRLRTGQSTRKATHLIKVAAETALGLRSKMDVFGTDYPTPDGTCVRDYVHVSDLVRAHADALAHLRRGGASLTLNCGYGHGASVLEVIATVKRVAGVDFRVDLAPRRPGDPARLVAACEQIRAQLGWQPRLDDLATIVGHALAWQRKLITRNA
jgi:UDP-glucose 4-epimerase